MEEGRVMHYTRVILTVTLLGLESLINSLTSGKKAQVIHICNARPTVCQRCLSVHGDGSVRLQAVFHERMRRPVARDSLDEVGPHDLAAVCVVPPVLVVDAQVGTLDEAVIIGGARLEQREQLRAAVHLRQKDEPGWRRASCTSSGRLGRRLGAV